MITGAREHELCALPWDDFEVDEDGIGTLWIRHGISKDHVGCRAVQDTKTHQQRRVTIDPTGTAVIVEHRARIVARLAEHGYELADDRVPDDAEHWKARIAKTLKNLVIYDELRAGRHGRSRRICDPAGYRFGMSDWAGRVIEYERRKDSFLLE